MKKMKIQMLVKIKKIIKKWMVKMKKVQIEDKILKNMKNVTEN